MIFPANSEDRAASGRREVGYQDPATPPDNGTFFITEQKRPLFTVLLGDKNASRRGFGLSEC